eukprot:2178868-Pleurochrysis_carterae.AAC.1
MARPVRARRLRGPLHELARRRLRIVRPPAGSAALGVEQRLPRMCSPRRTAPRRDGGVRRRPVAMPGRVSAPAQR